MILIGVSFFCSGGKMAEIQFGVSTASLYPELVEDALYALASLGAGAVEIFFNAGCELEEPVFGRLREILDEYGVNAVSVHPYHSPFESLCLFSGYERRVGEMIDTYKRYFDRMNKLGAEIFVLHGALEGGFCPVERYAERYSRLWRVGREFGVVVAQENVAYCKCGNLAFLTELCKMLGEEISLVLDMKQALRAGFTPLEMLGAVGERVVHIHASDNGAAGDCLPIGAGEFDFAELFARLEALGYRGAMLVELYRADYGEFRELVESAGRLEAMWKKFHQGIAK